MIIHCLIPLITGGLLYILFRSTNLRMFKWFSSIGLDNFIFQSRHYFLNLKYQLPNWTYYSLPDALWVYSFTSALLILWDGVISIWLIFVLFSGIFVEFAQWINIFPGTFDILDLIFTIMAFLFSIIIFNFKFKQNEKTISS